MIKVGFHADHGCCNYFRYTHHRRTNNARRPIDDDATVPLPTTTRLVGGWYARGDRVRVECVTGTVRGDSRRREDLLSSIVLNALR